MAPNFRNVGTRRESHIMCPLPPAALVLDQQRPRPVPNKLSPIEGVHLWQGEHLRCRIGPKAAGTLGFFEGAQVSIFGEHLR
jgi:hypothetical protein